jgi:hypothetical protein
MSGGREGVYLGGEFDEGERELRWPDKEITEGGDMNGERGRRRKKERKKERKERGKKGFDQTVMP